MAELAKVEGITVSEEEKQAELDRLADQAETPENATALREVFGSEAGLRVIEADVRSEKTLARLRAIVTGQAPELAPRSGSRSRNCRGSEMEVAGGSWQAEAK